MAQTESVEVQHEEKLIWVFVCAPKGAHKKKVANVANQQEQKKKIEWNEWMIKHKEKHSTSIAGKPFPKMKETFVCRVCSAIQEWTAHSGT